MIPQRKRIQIIKKRLISDLIKIEDDSKFNDASYLPVIFNRIVDRKKPVFAFVWSRYPVIVRIRIKSRIRFNVFVAINGKGIDEISFATVQIGKISDGVVHSLFRLLRYGRYHSAAIPSFAIRRRLIFVYSVAVASEYRRNLIVGFSLFPRAGCASYNENGKENDKRK